MNGFVYRVWLSSKEVWLKLTSSYALVSAYVDYYDLKVRR